MIEVPDKEDGGPVRNRNSGEPDIHFSDSIKKENAELGLRRVKPHVKEAFWPHLIHLPGIALSDECVF